MDSPLKDSFSAGSLLGVLGVLVFAGFALFFRNTFSNEVFGLLRSAWDAVPAVLVTVLATVLATVLVTVLVMVPIGVRELEARANPVIPPPTFVLVFESVPL